MMPSVRRHPEVEQWFYDMGRRHLARKPRTGWHVSDFLAPRKSYWARVSPRQPTDREVGYFLAGRGHEDAFVALSGLGEYRQLKGEWLGIPGREYLPGDGITYSVDALAPHSGGDTVPFELKTNRRPTIEPPETVAVQYDLAVRQLGMYCAALHKPSGYLLILHLMARNLAVAEDGDKPDSYSWIKESKPVLVAYQIDFTTMELDSIRTSMADERDRLAAALEIRSHTILPECPAWMCGKLHVRFSDPRCPSCSTVYKVGEERPDGKKQGILKKCKACKDGSGNRLDLVRDAKEVFLPTCKWWSQCLPSQWSKHHADYYDPGQDAPDAEEPPWDPPEQ